MSDDWKQVTDELSGLALKLKMHFQQAGSVPSSEEVKTAIGRLGDSVTEAFGAMRNAVSDPAVQDDVKNAGAALRDALYNTFSHLSSEVRERLNRTDDESAEGGTAEEASSATGGTAGSGQSGGSGGSSGAPSGGVASDAAQGAAGTQGGGSGTDGTGTDQTATTDPTSGIRQVSGPGQGTAVGGQDDPEQASGGVGQQRPDSEARPSADDEQAPSV